MAVKRWSEPQRHSHDDGRDRQRHEAELAARLAPLEETESFKKSAQGDGGRDSRDTIRVDKTSVKLPEKFLEGERDAASTFRPAPVVVVILVVMLSFIAFIAWQITLMPPAK